MRSRRVIFAGLFGCVALAFASSASAVPSLTCPDNDVVYTVGGSGYCIDVPTMMAAYETQAAMTAALLAYDKTVNGTPPNPATGDITLTIPSAFAVGTPNSRTPTLATAYQATDPTKSASITINLTSTAAISLSGGTTNSASVVIGSTNGVAGGTGTSICLYSNSNTGALTIGLNLSTVAASTCKFDLPVGWFWTIRQTAGTIAITSAYDQAIG